MMPSAYKFQNLEIQSSILSERVLLLSVGTHIDPEINKLIHKIASAIIGALIPGIGECIPAYASLSIHFDPQVVRNHFTDQLPADVVRDQVFDLIAKMDAAKSSGISRLIEIPVWYNGADLQPLSQHHGLSAGEVIEIHSGVTYQVYMIGFLPGFAYMGAIDPRIATPRHASPRQKVPSGSIAIAGMQTGIYPLESPGGWQLIGRTPMRLFNVDNNEPCLLNPGDQVKFMPVSESEFLKLHGS